VRSFSFQGEVSESGEKDSMIPQHTPILYRSGDQPNNAYTLNVTEVGEVAASGGTSGTVLLVSD
jgi:xylulokinase